MIASLLCSVWRRSRPPEQLLLVGLGRRDWGWAWNWEGFSWIEAWI